MPWPSQASQCSTTPSLALKGATLCPMPRITYAKQGLPGMPHATEGNTSPPWPQTPSSCVRLAFTVHILAPGCPGSAQCMPTAQVVCPGASSSHASQEQFFLLSTPSPFHSFIQTNSLEGSLHARHCTCPGTTPCTERSPCPCPRPPSSPQHCCFSSLQPLTCFG